MNYSVRANPKKWKENSPSKLKVDYIPLHFFSWIKHGPASDNQHPLWIPDTGKPQVKANADILESNDVVSGNGKLSSYSRKAKRLEMNAKNDTESKVLDLSAGMNLPRILSRYLPSRK